MIGWLIANCWWNWLYTMLPSGMLDGNPPGSVEKASRGGCSAPGGVPAAERMKR